MRDSPAKKAGSTAGEAAHQQRDSWARDTGQCDIPELGMVNMIYRPRKKPLEHQISGGDTLYVELYARVNYNDACSLIIMITYHRTERRWIASLKKSLMKLFLWQGFGIPVNWWCCMWLRREFVWQKKKKSDRPGRRKGIADTGHTAGQWWCCQRPSVPWPRHQLNEVMVLTCEPRTIELAVWFGTYGMEWHFPSCFCLE